MIVKEPQLANLKTLSRIAAGGPRSEASDLIEAATAALREQASAGAATWTSPRISRAVATEFMSQIGMLEGADLDAVFRRGRHVDVGSAPANWGAPECVRFEVPSNRVNHRFSGLEMFLGRRDQGETWGIQLRFEPRT